MPNDDWMKLTKGGKRKSAYSSREPVRKEKGSSNRREGDFVAEKMDKGLPLTKNDSKY